jgi:transcriptional regulator with XRE-family HTH domain
MLTAEPTPQIGPLLRHWRAARRMSQLDLALEANVSTRHVSFVETGRAQPSRQLVLALADVLAVPPRERNALLLAAGYAPLYRETDLAAPAMGQVRRALALILRQQDPFPTIALDRGWQLVMVNTAWARLAAHLALGALPALTVLPEPRPNLLRLLCDPAGLRPHLANWELVARNLFHRARHDAANHPPTAALLAELAARPDLAVSGVAGGAGDWHEPPREPASGLLLPITLRLGERRVHLLSTITTLGTAQDLTLQELHIEALYPADADAEALLRQMGE